ncbi:MAG: hypothetical protein J5J00_06835 [Deltaproteobacteria bacterium]|nr:hypothetical protein [Deltaproteobacteria bacterium]
MASLRTKLRSTPGSNPVTIARQTIPVVRFGGGADGDCALGGAMRAYAVLRHRFGLGRIEVPFSPFPTSDIAARFVCELRTKLDSPIPFQVAKDRVIGIISLNDSSHFDLAWNELEKLLPGKLWRRARKRFNAQRKKSLGSKAASRHIKERRPAKRELAYV